MSKEPSEQDYALATKVVPEIAAPELPYRPPVPKSYRAEDRAGRGRGHFLRPSRRLPPRRFRCRGHRFTHAGARPRRGATSSFRRPRRRPTSRACSAGPTSRCSTSRRIRPSACRWSRPHFGRASTSCRKNLSWSISIRASVWWRWPTRMGVKLAVNQNGRWAPHFAYMREAVKAGLIGDLVSCHTGVHWDHSWIEGTPFEKIDDLVFFDFAIHWFDFLSSLIGDQGDERVRDAQPGRRPARRAAAACAGAGRVRRRTGFADLRRRDQASARSTRPSSAAPRAASPAPAPISASSR